MNTRGPGQRAGLTHAAVLTAAEALVAESGVAALTMRALAERLGVRPNTIYSHVANKDELIDQLLDAVLAAVPPAPADAPDPTAALADVMTSTFEVLMTRRDLVPAYLARQGSRGPVAQQLGESMRLQFERLGVPVEHRQEAVRVLVVFTIGYAAFAGRADPVLDAAVVGADFRRGLGWLLAGVASDQA